MGIESVVNAIRIHIYGDCVMNDNYCPYRKYANCSDMLMADVLEILNARVLNQEEIINWNGYVWKEYKGKDPMSGVLIDHGIEMIPFDKGFDTKNYTWSTYNLTWRIWTGLPTNEQRKKEEWGDLYLLESEEGKKTWYA